MHYSAAKIIEDTNAHTGRFSCIKALENTVVAAIVAENITGTLTSVTLNSNTSIEGVITSVTLASGTVIAYTY